eukprot:CAMPEP_0119038746 /NCGR_PEP_ID=MMETSP1177-20130426/7849_1 /TAXON_ID=2985 /ORGANISM="Ochromonas sp, Strain CCMP1899" /LENGTH=382 /DNA_ID=CAMNT_0007001727 /DNA_START=180 /DNA_END=1329 /DNA_ORIENTATION=-
MSLQKSSTVNRMVMELLSKYVCYIAILIVLCQQIYAEKISSYSFEGPFRDIDNSGSRTVNKHWRSGGSTVINNNFVRLTPDQQSKKGALWTREPLGINSFSSIIKFRISGKGKDFFGDGIALWFVQQGFYNEGEVHGFQEQYVGVGIVFDTFKNTEDPASHRDVTILINDGEKTWKTMVEDVQGCNMMGLRYDNKRGDFKVSDYSQAKIVITDKKLSVLVDPQGDEEWKPCVEIDDVKLPEEWLSDAYIGITASTGQLSDNHDVISLVTYEDEHVMDQTEEKKRTIKADKFQIAPDINLDDRLDLLDVKTNEVLRRLEWMDKHYEHSYVSMADNIDDIREVVKEKEDISDIRLKEIESLVRQEVDEHMPRKLDTLKATENLI